MTIEGTKFGVSTSNSQLFRAVALLILTTVLSAGCTSGESAQPAPTVPADTESARNTTDVDDDAAGKAVETSEPEPSPSAVPPAPVLADQNLASVVNLSAGEQVEDAQGNLLAIYGITKWPNAFEALSNDAQTAFPFFGDVEDLRDPAATLMALDIGICTAGIDATGFGTAEFTVHTNNDEVLLTEPILGRGVLAGHPVTQPGFEFPRPAECGRGWLPVLWSGSDTPGFARYVLATRSAAASEVERHVYQWPIELSNGDAEIATETVDDELFRAGQTVTFNDGLLLKTTVKVDGWAELIDVETGIDGTRAVAVSLNICPHSVTVPQFGLSVDGWNIVAPVPGPGLLGDGLEGETAQDCFDGWLEFAVPFGGVPTGFFASDGVDATNGYAQWSLDNAALPAPQ